MPDQYYLSAILAEHSQDVKAVISPTVKSVISASRDRQVITWFRTSDIAWEKKGVNNEHSHFVNSLTYVPPTSDYPKGLIASGSNDKTIMLFDPRTPNKTEITLIGHSENVCVLTSWTNGDVISGSWDKTSKLWREGECVYTVDHDQAVWALLALDDNSWLTGSADKTIKLWMEGEQIKTYYGHDDAVRGLAPLPDVGFASCSNDGTIRAWNMAGDTLWQHQAHDSFIYCLVLTPSGELASSSEDGTLRIWKNQHEQQVIPHPCPTIWCVTAIRNGDIATAGSDGKIRIFTRSVERRAPPELAQNDVPEVREEADQEPIDAQELM